MSKTGGEVLDLRGGKRMDYAEEILRMIVDASKLERSGVRVDIEDKLEYLYQKLDPGEQGEFRTAIVKLIGHPDQGISETMLLLCPRLEVVEARPVIINMLRNWEYWESVGYFLPRVMAALDRTAAREMGAVLSRIALRYRSSPLVHRRGSPTCEAALMALARGNPIAVAPYLRPIFDDELEHGFKSWPAGPEYYGGLLEYLLRDIIVEYGSDGLDLIREIFKGIPAEREAYLRVLLERTKDRLREPRRYNEAPPVVPDDIFRQLQEYADSLSPTTWYTAPALPKEDTGD